MAQKRTVKKASAKKRTAAKKAPARKPAARKPRAIPKGYEAVTPFLMVDGAAKALDFYRKAFGAKERMRMPGPGGRIMHAEMDLAKTVIMLSDETPEMSAWAPGHFGGSPVSMHLYVDDVDKFVARAVKAGATLTRPPKDQFYGDRSASLTDPFGHLWHFATHVEDVPPAEMRRRAKELEKQYMASQQAGGTSGSEAKAD